MTGPLEQRNILEDLLRALDGEDRHDSIAARLERLGEFSPQQFASLDFSQARADPVAVGRFDQGKWCHRTGPFGANASGRQPRLVVMVRLSPAWTPRPKPGRPLFSRPSRSPLPRACSAVDGTILIPSRMMGLILRQDYNDAWMALWTKAQGKEQRRDVAERRIKAAGGTVYSKVYELPVDLPKGFALDCIRGWAAVSGFDGGLRWVRRATVSSEHTCAPEETQRTAAQAQGRGATRRRPYTGNSCAGGLSKYSAPSSAWG